MSQNQAHFVIKETFNTCHIPFPSEVMKKDLMYMWIQETQLLTPSLPFWGKIIDSHAFSLLTL